MLAQQLTGSFGGSVTDPQSAVIPGASITARHNETNTAYTATTNEAGRFRMPNVRLGAYTVTAEADGFKRSIVTGVRVEVGTTSTLTIPLEVGELVFEVTVTAEAAQAVLNTVDAELSTTVDNRRVLELPLNGRNAAELIMQQAGVYFERTPDGQGDKFFVHGQRHRSIQITLDGIDTQDNYNKASSIMVDQPLLALAAENVQEFKVVTGIASAEYSRGGAQISAVTRSGGNQFHGSLFLFNRNDAVSANDFFNNRSGVDIPQLNRNQFGGRIGGPIKRDRTFFYFGYQQTRQIKGVSTNPTVYTAEARQGIFRYLERVPNTPANVAAADPNSILSVNLLECSAAVSGVLERDCVDKRFDGTNPTSLDPFITGTVFGAMPLPNNTDTGDGLNTGGFRFNAKSFTIEHLPSVRLDHRISNKHNFYATLNYVDRNIMGDFINNRLAKYPSLDSLGNRVTHSKGFSAALTSTFTPTIVNEARFGFLGGENAFLINQPFGTPFTLDLETITDPYDWDDNNDVRDNRTVHLRNTTSWVKGNHQLKFGVEWRERFVDRYDFDRVNAAGAIGFDDNDAATAFSTGNLNKLSGASRINSTNAETARDLINNLTGTIGEVFQNYNVETLDSGFVPFFPERRSFKNHEFDWFINDQWQLKPNFTLNLGVRWEYATVPYVTNGLALAPEGGLNAAFGISGPQGFFNPGTFDGTPCSELAGLPADKTKSNAVALIQGCATRYFPATSSNGRPLWNDDFNNFGPVASIAWDPFGDGKTSVRAGFRISYIQDAFSIAGANLDDNEGLEVRQSCIPEDGECPANPLLLRDVIAGTSAVPDAPVFQLPAVRTILDSSTIDFRGYDQEIGTAYYNEWTFGVSREIFDNWAFEARYIGNRGVAQRRMADFNEINVDVLDPVTGQTFRDAFILKTAVARGHR